MRTTTSPTENQMSIMILYTHYIPQDVRIKSEICFKTIKWRTRPTLVHKPIIESNHDDVTRAVTWYQIYQVTMMSHYDVLQYIWWYHGIVTVWPILVSTCQWILVSLYDRISLSCIFKLNRDMTRMSLAYDLLPWQATSMLLWRNVWCFVKDSGDHDAMTPCMMSFDSLARLRPSESGHYDIWCSSYSICHILMNLWNSESARGCFKSCQFHFRVDCSLDHQIRAPSHIIEALPAAFLGPCRWHFIHKSVADPAIAIPIAIQNNNDNNRNIELCQKILLQTFLWIYVYWQYSTTFKFAY